MISTDRIIAASLGLEPDRAAVARDVHRAAARGIPHLVVNENMVAEAMAEVQGAGLSVRVSGIVGFPIGQWVWPAKKVAIDELSAIQNGPCAVMHGVGPWLDAAPFSREEFAGLATMVGEKWVVTSLTAIPPDRFAALADDLASCGTRLLILSNGVAASGLPLPDTARISAMAEAAGGRFRLAAMAPAETEEETILASLEAGADNVVCADFWTLTEGNRSS